MATKRTTRKKPAARKSAARRPAKRKVARRAAPRRAAARKKAPARRKPAAVKAVKASTTPIRARLTKGQVVKAIAEETQLSRTQVAAVLDGLERAMHRSVRKGSVGEFVWPGLMKIKAVPVKARAARPGVNPFTGEKITIKARPASRSVRIRPLKTLKGYASS